MDMATSEQNARIRRLRTIAESMLLAGEYKAAEAVDEAAAYIEALERSRQVDANEHQSQMKEAAELLRHVRTVTAVTVEDIVKWQTRCDHWLKAASSLTGDL